jgi:5-methylcytosine-specific restriction endonuclease McrA
VIRLREMVHRPRPRVKLSRREVFRRDHYTCQYCGRKDGRLTLDHVVPRHMGGQHSWTNVVTACEACNARKGGRTLEEAHMQLLHPPREPAATALYLFGHLLDQYQEWEPFLIGW